MVDLMVQLQYDMFLIKVSPGGEVLSAWSYGADAGDSAYALAIDSSGENLYIGGQIGSTMKFCGTVTSSGYAAFLGKMVSSLMRYSSKRGKGLQIDGVTHQGLVVLPSFTVIGCLLREWFSTRAHHVSHINRATIIHLAMCHM